MKEDKAQNMSGNERMEHWRNQTLINRTNSNNDIAREYLSLINFIKNNYVGRVECIQNPILHLVSHCLELCYKNLIETAISNAIISKKSVNLHEHDLKVLFENIERIVNLLDDTSFTEEEKELIETAFKESHVELINLLNSTTTTYRYAYKISRQGNKERGHPFNDDYDSPNMLDIYNKIEDAFLSILFIDCRIEESNNL